MTSTRVTPERMPLFKLKRSITLSLFCAGALCSSAVIAQEQRMEYPVGNMVAYPIFNISGGYSNTLYDSEGNAESGSPSISILLGAGLQGKRRGHFYGIEYAADTTYFSESDLDEQQYVDQRLVGYWGTAFTQRQNLDLGVQIRDSQLPRSYGNPIDGTNNTIDDASGEEWTEYQAGALYVLGNDETKGRLELAACLTCRRYDSDDYEYRDSNIIDTAATLYTRVAPKTEMLFEIVYTQFDYRNSGAGDFTEDLDSTEMRYLVGATWEATRKTTGTAKIGYVDKQFDTGSGREDYSGLLLDLAVDWNPNRYNAVRMHYMYRPYESIEYSDLAKDDYVEINELDLTWSKAWSPRVFTNMSGYVGRDEYNESGRTDDRYGLELGVRYKTARYGSIGVTLFTENRDSSLTGYDYEDQGIMLDYDIGSLLFGFGEQRAADICNIR